MSAALAVQRTDANHSATARTCLTPAQDGVARLEPHWRALAEDASEPNAFAEHWFFAAGLDSLGTDTDVRLLEAWDGGRLVGVLPLIVSGRYGRMPVRHVTNWLHHHCFLGTPLVRAGAEDCFWRQALALLDDSPWAEGFLHIAGLVEQGPVHRALAGQRRCDTVHRSQRALLDSILSPQDYYEQAVRKKKRKELKRLRSRLEEIGTLSVARLAEPDALPAWTDAFLALERAQWKGGAGTALACSAQTEAFFRQALAGACAAGRLEMLRMDLDRRPLAMLINFLSPPGAFSFKIAFDEAYARFSPGVLIQIENLDILARPGIGWMDSCAVEEHPMINSLWRERRPLARVTVPLAGPRARALFHFCRTAEDGYARLKRLHAPKELPSS